LGDDARRAQLWALPADAAVAAVAGGLRRASRLSQRNEWLESDRKTCYALLVMAKPLNASSKDNVVKGSPSTTTVVIDPKSGQSVTVKGFGALKDFELKFKKGVDIVKPIAEQVLSRRPEKRRAR
jgi:hypothetical protein